MTSTHTQMSQKQMSQEAALLLRAARQQRGERREHMLEEARLWVRLAETPHDDVPHQTVPEGTVMRIRTRAGALTVVRETMCRQGREFPWACLGCGEGREIGRAHRADAREEATRHAHDCWVLPATQAELESR
ncbi:hypothetical protein ACIQNG_35485 [Streptomyces sp. NPDC091377]|uniref:hypothetical protein n=1 Tax=Streptomyces sp. NPDC091377 TaxID=3365995 RepID=UPI0038020900